MNARVQAIRDERHEDADKLPSLSFWTPGSEIAEAVKATATYVGGPVSMRLKWAGGSMKVPVFVKSVVFKGDKEAVFTVAIEVTKPFQVEVGEEIEVTFEGGRK